MAKKGKTLDSGMYQKIRKDIDGMKKVEVATGFFPDARVKDGATGSQALVATVLEFGSKRNNIPERPFMRSAADKNRAKYKKLFRARFSDVLTQRMSLHRALSAIGAATQGDIVKTITDLRQPPNTPETVKRKKSSNPLINIGTMRDSVKFKVKL